MKRLTLDDIKPLLPKRLNSSTKYTNGYVFSYSGSNRYPGAAILAAQSAMRVGAGGVYAYSENQVLPLIINQLPEAIILKNDAGDHEIQEILKKTRSILVGPGLHPKTFNFDKLKRLLKLSSLPVLIDAEGINVISYVGIERFIKEIPTEMRERCLLTPHMGEMKRLIGNVTDKGLIEFAQVTRTTLYLKGFPGKLISPSGSLTEYASGSPAATTAGCGDTLSGIFAGYLAQGLNLMDAAKVGIFVSSMASDLYAQHYGAHTMLASDVINMLPRVLREIYD